MKEYLRSVAAYLTGWVIAQAIFQRVVKYIIRDAREADWRKWSGDLAVVLADELESRRRAR